MVNIKSEELLTCFILIVICYIIAKIFSRNCECFNLGGQPNSRVNNCDDFITEASLNCGDDATGNLSQDCCDTILNPNNLNCDVSTIDDIIRQDVITAQNTCNTLYPSQSLDSHYDYNLISDVPDNTCLSSPEKIKEFSNSCDLNRETMTNCDSCRNAVYSYFNKCDNFNMRNIYLRELIKYCV